MSQQSAPGEEDLRQLYNEVWATYLEDDTAQRPQRSDTVSTSGEMESIYGAYGDDEDRTKLAGRVPSVGNNSTSGASISYQQRAPEATNSPTTPTARKGLRPLPPTPGMTPSPSPSSRMPEPQAYNNGTVDYHRDLPPAPGGTENGSHSGDSPVSSTSGYRQAPHVASIDSPPYTMPVPGTGTPYYTPTGLGDGTYSGENGLSRQVSTRPAGAGASYNGAYDGVVQDVSSGYSNSSASAGVLNPESYFNQEKVTQSSGSGAGTNGYVDRHNSAHSTTTAMSDAPSHMGLQQSSSYATTPGGDLGGYTGAMDQSYLSAYGGNVVSSTSQLSPGGSMSANHLEQLAALKGPLGLHDEEGDLDVDWVDDESEGDDSRFVNFSLLSHIAVRLKDKVPRGTHVKGSIPYPQAFTGKDVVSTIQSQIQRELLINHGVSTSDRRAALQVARSLQSQLFFYEVEWGGRVLQDGVEDVYMFLDDQEGGSGADFHPEREELPTGVITMLTKCYSPSCGEGGPCYSYSCPRKTGEWSETVPKEVLDSLPKNEVQRQTVIHKMVTKEEQYVADLDTVEQLFIRPLRNAHPPVIPIHDLDDFIEEVFGNILDLRECNRRLLERMYVRQREQGPVIQRIGDIFLEAATEFRLAYPIYIGHLPLAEKRLKDEIDDNPEFRLFLEECSRQSARAQDRRLDLRHFLTRPSEHLQKYPVLLEAIHGATTEGNPDSDFVMSAVEAIKNLQSVAQLRTFQCAMGRGAAGKWEWHDLVSTDVRQALPKGEAKRQSIIFELIKGEQAYVKDLENIEIMYVRPLRSMDPSIIPRDRLEAFIQDVYHNFGELHAHHLKLLDRLHEIQREEHPLIRTVTAPLFDAALNFRDAYMEYIPNYPIAAYRIDDEMATNPPFKDFCEQVTRHPDSHRLDMKSFINRPIPRLLRYELLLKGVLEETPKGHEDIEAIPQVLDIIKALGKETEPGVQSAKQKVQLWNYNTNLVFKPGEAIDLDLLNENRSLIHTGKWLRQPESGIEWNWSELFVLLFDNYLVMTKPKDRDGVTKYIVNRRPIPLDLLTLANFTDPPTQRSGGIFKIRGGGGGGGQRDPDQSGNSAVSPDSSSDSRAVFPCTIHHNGRVGGLMTLYAETAAARVEWKAKLEEATGLRKVVQESNKVFEIETLSTDTFLVPSMLAGANTPSWNQENSFTGKVTCSVPFATADGRALVAIGCAEGVWIGFRHDSRSMRRVLHLKMVTQCAMLEEFGIFLVLADKSLFAYHIEALVPSNPQSVHTSQTPQKLNGTKDVHFFSVGSLQGRTLVIYMKKKGLDSVFRVLEPVVGKINEKTKAPVSLSSRLGIRSPRSEWFRVYRDFFLPSESFDLIFLKAKIAILCTKGFEIMDLTDFKSVTIPLRDEARLEKLVKRSESCKPKGMFRIAEEFLLCYDEFGLYVDKHGEPSRALSTIEWEGTAEQVAIHPPYVLLFDSRFIEIRHVSTGRLVQIIPGSDIHCLWDGRGLSTNIVNTGPESWSEGMSQEPRIHAVMNAPDPVTSPGTGLRPRAVAQHVFELIPTVPLYLPGSLAAPSTTTYFAQGSSSASQNISPTNSWR
ncbi:hypothetical protein HWV62_21862 [Athelia sp. TMB]|nr:hypothetical protein HWV62_21862 [Athelia sp. TMB]